MPGRVRPVPAAVRQRGSACGEARKAVRGAESGDRSSSRSIVREGSGGSNARLSGSSERPSRASAVRHSPFEGKSGSGAACGSAPIANASLANRTDSASLRSDSPMRSASRARGLGREGTRQATLDVVGVRSRVSRIGNVTPPSRERRSSISFPLISRGISHDMRTVAPGSTRDPARGDRKPGGELPRDTAAASVATPKAAESRAVLPGICGRL